MLPLNTPTFQKYHIWSLKPSPCVTPMDFSFLGKHTFLIPFLHRGKLWVCQLWVNDLIHAPFALKYLL